MQDYPISSYLEYFLDILIPDSSFSAVMKYFLLFFNQTRIGRYDGKFLFDRFCKKYRQVEINKKSWNFEFKYVCY